jgi:hypothetical protein
VSLRALIFRYIAEEASMVTPGRRRVRFVGGCNRFVRKAVRLYNLLDLSKRLNTSIGDEPGHGHHHIQRDRNPGAHEGQRNRKGVNN